MEQVTELDKEFTAQGYPILKDIGHVSLCIRYPFSQLYSPSVTLTLKALPHAVPQLCQWICWTDTLVVSFKDFLVAESM
jgi:hypothetical protein